MLTELQAVGKKKLKEHTGVPRITPYFNTIPTREAMETEWSICQERGHVETGRNQSYDALRPSGTFNSDELLLPNPIQNSVSKDSHRSDRSSTYQPSRLRGMGS